MKTLIQLSLIFTAFVIPTLCFAGPPSMQEVKGSLSDLAGNNSSMLNLAYDGYRRGYRFGEEDKNSIRGPRWRDVPANQALQGVLTGDNTRDDVIKEAYQRGYADGKAE